MKLFFQLLSAFCIVLLILIFISTPLSHDIKILLHNATMSLENILQIISDRIFSFTELFITSEGKDKKLSPEGYSQKSEIEKAEISKTGLNDGCNSSIEIKTRLERIKILRVETSKLCDEILRSTEQNEN